MGGIFEIATGLLGTLYAHATNSHGASHFCFFLVCSVLLVNFYVPDHDEFFLLYTWAGMERFDCQLDDKRRKHLSDTKARIRRAQKPFTGAAFWNL